MARDWTGHREVRLGIGANLGQFLVQTLLVFFVGMTIGLERTVVPVLAKDEFAIASSSVILSFVFSFGVVKALLNLYGGRLSESWGRRPILILGWLVALPIPLLIIWAPNWWWIVFANLLLGVNQGLAWSMTVTSKMDIVGGRQRGLAIGINESAGYGGVATAAVVTGYLAGAYGLRPVPFVFGMAVIVAALAISLALARETRGHALAEAANPGSPGSGPQPPEPAGPVPRFWDIFRWTSWRDRAMFAVSQAGLIEKFTDTLVWVSFPLFFKARGLSVGEIGLVVGVYGFTWGVLQLATGPLSDKVGRKGPIVLGMWLAGAGVWLTVLVEGMALWMATSALIGLGMALLYPTLLAAVGDASDPQWRGTSLGVYRMWRDSGMAFGALGIGVMSDLFSLSAGFYFTAAAMFASGGIVALRMYETGPDRLGVARGRRSELAGAGTASP
ncbi:MAG: MFS transporter [Dehalococcoidia bacterium]